jgi:hypothetical protein
MWTPTALASEARELAGTVWRVVEHQHTTSTRKIVDTLAEQEVLEAILEKGKPPYPAEAERLHYLLKTPFRYYPPYPHGSRFRRAQSGDGVFYGSEHIRTALAEFSYHRIRFFSASPQTPLPRNEERLTAFTTSYATSRGLDLTRPPLKRDRVLWTSPRDYTATQALVEAARQAELQAIRSESVRDAETGINMALLTPRVFTTDKPITQQTWLFYLAGTEVNCVQAEDRGAERWVFPRSQFAI